MNDSPATRRLHYGWVVTLAFAAMLTGLFWLLMLVSPSSQAYEFATIMTGVIGIALALPLMAWLVITWIFFRRFRRTTTVLALLPSALLIASAVVETATLRPREEIIRQHFKREFKIEMPADAHDMDVSGPTFGGDRREFVFRCSKESTQSLIRTLHLEPRQGQAPQGIGRLGRKWSPPAWTGARLYLPKDGHGNKSLLVTGSSMGSVWMGHDCW